MTMAELFATLVERGALPAGQVKDIKTSVAYLAQALGHPSPNQCPVDLALRDEAIWYAKLEAHFTALTTGGRAISSKTRSNTRNNIRRLMRAAAGQGLLEAPAPVVLFKRPLRREFQAHRVATTPYLSSWRPALGPRRFGLPQAEWPADIQAGWKRYTEQCDISIRQVRLDSNVAHLRLYLGYLTHIVGRQPTWEDIFDKEQLRAFVQWHAARLQRSPISVGGWQMVIVAATIAKVLGRDEARKLADFRNDLPIPAEVHDKEAHWVSLAQLEAVAEALLQEGRAPDPSEKRTVHPGFRAASRFQRGMILKFMIRIPVRQRNIREMQLGKNLYQDREGHWHVRFRGAELKVGMRGASVNVYHVDLTDYCPDLIPVLEEFLTIRRPKLPNAAESDYVFVTRFGNPFTAGHLREELHTAVAMRTGRRFYPHLIRTVWATEYLTHPKTYGNYQGAAYMLGDTVQMVIKVYAHVVEKEQLAKAADFLGAVLGKKSA